LRAFIDGYEWGCAHTGVPSGVDPRLGRFSEWVAEKLGRGTLSVSGWCMLRVKCEDEARALERFFALWDEYTRFVEPAVETARAQAPPLPTMSFRQLLAAVQHRPAMYLGQSLVTLLQAFIRGYVTALQDAGRSTVEVPDLGAFSHWLSARHGLPDGYRWDRILLLFHGEAGAFEEFFSLLSDFEAGSDARR
jgi:hypothetical protein